MHNQPRDDGYCGNERRGTPRRKTDASVLWRRDGEEVLHEGRLLDETDRSRAFVTAYEQRPERTDLISIIIPSPARAEPMTCLAMVRRVDSFGEDACRVVCTDVRG